MTFCAPLRSLAMFTAAAIASMVGFAGLRGSAVTGQVQCHASEFGGQRVDLRRPILMIATEAMNEDDRRLSLTHDADIDVVAFDHHSFRRARLVPGNVSFPPVIRSRPDYPGGDCLK